MISVIDQALLPYSPSQNDYSPHNQFSESKKFEVDFATTIEDFFVSGKNRSKDLTGCPLRRCGYSTYENFCTGIRFRSVIRRCAPLWEVFLYYLLLLLV